MRLTAHRTELATLQELAARRDALIADLGVRLAAHRTDLATLQELVVQQHNALMHLSSKATAWEGEVAALAGLARFMTGRRVLLGFLRRSASERFRAIHAHTAGAQIDHLLSDELLHWLLRRRTLLGLARRSKLAGEAVVTRAMAEPLRKVQARRFEDLRESTRLGASVAATVSNALSVLDDLRGLLRLDASMAASVSNSLSVLDDLRGLLRLDASGGPTLANHLRSAGWGPKAPPFPVFPGQLLRQCLRDSALGEEAELAWVKKVIHGWHPPSDTDALQASAARVRDSGLFDARFYGKQAGIARDRTDPAAHYVLLGDTLGLSPSASFDPAYYGDRNPDVVADGRNRLLHYLETGRHEGRHPLPLPPLHVNKERIDELRENVILVVHETSRTGAPMLGWNIAQHLATRYNVFTVTLGGGPLMEDFKALSAELYGPFEHGRRHPVDIEYGLRRLLDERTFKYAIINSCESRPVIEVCVKWLIPTVMLMHEFGSYIHTSDSLRTAFDMASEIVFPAQIVACSSLEVHPPLRERSIRILPQGVCVPPGGATASHARSSPVVDDLARVSNEGAFIVLGAGTVHYRKGVDLFLATAMAVNRDAADSRVHFVWVGRGYRPKEDMGYSIYLLEQLERSGLRDRVTFLEDVPDLEPIYALTDAFLLSSRLDPLPNVSIDAAHRGIPIVCFKDASGTADLLFSDPETARGVVDHLDPAAAGREILSLARDYDHYTRTAAATRRVAQSLFDMAKYVEAIDALGAAASVRAARKREDADLLCRTEDFDQDMFLGPEPVFESRARTVRCAVAHSGMHGNYLARRRTAPGFNPLLWRLNHAEPGTDDPLAEFVRAGRPSGPWFTPVLRPMKDPARLKAPGIRALLHVHLSDTDQAANLLMRLQTNRLRFDLLVSADSVLEAEFIRGMLSSFDRGAIHVTAAEVEGESAIRWLLSELEQPEWGVHDVIGHLHDDSIDSNNASIDFHWTALLGGRQPMLDRVLHAFAFQPALGLVFPSDPLLPDPDVTADYPSGGMFWARRATLDRLRDNDVTCSTRVLPEACEAAGLTQAVTHVPGVFR